MLRSTISRRTRVCVTALALALTLPPALTAQQLTEPQLKAAFLYNFARFAEWPKDVVAPNSELVICVIGDTAVADILVRTSQGHDIDGHRIVIARGSAGMLPTCHVLYVKGLDARRSAALLEPLKGSPVFTVSDFDEFTRLGGVARFFPENGRMRFAINVDAALRAHIYISSKLLNLATIVKDEPHPTDR